MNNSPTFSPLDLCMRDGVRLASQYWAPQPAAASRPLPILLCRTAQPLTRLERFVQELTLLGYPVVLQSVRGRGNSRGKFRPYFQECEDGADTILALLREKLVGDNGVLPIGLGYDGQTALSLALSAPPELLRGLAASAPSASHFLAGLCTNGLPSGPSLYHLAQWLPKNVRPRRAAFAAWLAQPRWAPGVSPFASAPTLEEWVLEMRGNAAFTPFWKHPALCPRAYLRQLPDLPTFLAAGTSATTCAGTMSLAQQLSSRNSSPLEIWMGEWDDDTLEDYAPDAPVARRLLEWLKTFSQKNAADAPGQRNINYLIQEVDEPPDWRRWSNWPSLNQDTQELYLAPGRLGTRPPATSANDDFLDNPLDPPPASTPWSFAPCEPRFGEFHLPLAVRGDLLAFTSPPFATPIKVLGAPRLRLRVASNRPDTQFLARLVLLPPRGPARAIAFGAARLALRYGAEQLVAYSPTADASTTLNLPLQPIAWQLPAGTRLRLEVSTNDFPRFPLAANALPEKKSPAAPRSVRNTIEFDTRGTSRLTLPIFNKDPPGEPSNELPIPPGNSETNSTEELL